MATHPALLANLPQNPLDRLMTNCSSLQKGISKITVRAAWYSRETYYCFTWRSHMKIFPSRFLHLSNCSLSAVRCLRTMSPTKPVKVSDVPALGDKGIASRLSIYQGESGLRPVTP